MVPVLLLRVFVAIGLSLATLLPLAADAERSPVFGSATIEALSPEAARDITARGFWADHYGAMAVSYAHTAYVFAYYGRHFSVSNSAQEQSWYGAAAFHAYHAWMYSIWAQSYSSWGQ